MKVNIEDLSTVKKRVTVTLSKEKVDEELKNELLKIAKVAQIKGFRKGKAPFAMVEKVYMPEAMERFADRAIRESLKTVVDENNLNLAVSPVVESQNFGDEGFVFNATLEIHPRVELKKYKGLTFKKGKVNVTDEEIAEKIEELRKRLGELKDRESGEHCEDGDIVEILVQKYEVDGKEMGSNFHESIDLSKKEIFPEIREALIGSKVGEIKEIKIKYPEDINDENLASKEGFVSFEVKGIKRHVYPSDEVLAEKNGVNSIDELKDKIKSELISGKQAEVDRNFRKEVFRILAEENSFEVPPTSIDELAYKMAEDLYNTYKRYGMDPDKLGLDWANIIENYKGEAERSLKQQYLIKAIKEAENLDVSEEEVEEKLEQLFGNIPDAEKIKYFQNSNIRNNLYVDMVSKKVFDFIVSQNNVVEE